MYFSFINIFPFPLNILEPQTTRRLDRKKIYAFVTSHGLNGARVEQKRMKRVRARTMCAASSQRKPLLRRSVRVNTMTVTGTMTAMTTLFQLRPASRENNATRTFSHVLSIHVSPYIFHPFFFFQKHASLWPMDTLIIAYVSTKFPAWFQKVDIIHFVEDNF